MYITCFVKFIPLVFHIFDAIKMIFFFKFQFLIIYCWDIQMQLIFTYDLAPSDHEKLIYSSSSFLDSIGFSMQLVMSSEIKGSFTYFFPSGCFYYLLLDLLYCPETFSNIQNKSGDKEHFCLDLNLSGQYSLFRH